MDNNRSYAKPKPIKDTSVDEHEVVLQAKGGHGGLKAVVNILHSIGIVTTESYYKRADGRVEQKIIVHVRETAKRYAERPEQPFEDKSGDVYLMRSLQTIGKYKLGHSIHARQREHEVIVDYGEEFQIIGIHYCSTDRFAFETWLKKEVIKWGAKHVERETYMMTDEHVEKFISLPNE